MSLDHLHVATRESNEPCLEPVIRDAGGTRLHPLLARRHSPRAFSPAPIADDALLRLLQAARWAPSSRNEQPWEFVIVRRGTAAFTDAVEVLAPPNRVWAQHAGLLLLGVARVSLPDGSPNRYAHYDLGQAAAQLALQATAEGLRLHPMGGFDRVRARELFALPDSHEPVVMIAVGHPADASGLDERLQAMEQAPRTRRPLQAFAFEGRFGQPLTLGAPSPGRLSARSLP